MILNETQIIDYLVKVRNKKVKSELERAKDFVKEFNQEAKKQKSKWHAEIGYCNTKLFGKFILLWIKKTKGFFKKTTQLHIHAGDHYYSFVNNDYAISDYSNEQNKEIFRLLPEVRSILNNISLTFSILEDYSEETMYKNIRKINERITELEEAIL